MVPTVVRLSRFAASLERITSAREGREEGIAQRPLDVDMVEIMGYGFPRWRGGPMCAADIIGLDQVLGKIREYTAEDAFYWAPAPLLQRLVADGKTFSDLNGG